MEYASELEADFQRYYQIDLGDLWRGTLSVRRAGVLASQLPAGSNLWLAVDSQAQSWTLDTHLLASILHAVQGANWQRGGGKGKKPEPITRPGEAREAERRDADQARRARRSALRTGVRPTT